MGLQQGGCFSLPGILVPWPPSSCFSSQGPLGKLFASPFPMAATLPLPATTQAGGLMPTALLQSGARAGSKVKQVEDGLTML